MIMIKDGKNKSNSFYQQVFVNVLFRYEVDQESLCKFKLGVSKQFKETTPTHCQFLDLR